jgi:hypothetical protein
VRSTALAKIVVGVEVEEPMARFPLATGSVAVGMLSAVSWTRIGEEGDATTLFAGEAAIELHRTETANCRQNLCSGMPALWSFCDR